MITPTPEQLETLTGGRYAVERLLAAGGMGAVFVGRHRNLGSKVAIKVLPQDVAASAVRMARFRREAALAAHLSHPHIVQVFEFDARDDVAYLVMPLIEGETLEQHLARSGPLDYTSLRDLMRQVGSALAFAHARGVVHRDIKPSNILLEEPTGRWLVTDFGVARADLVGDTAITQSGVAVGTPAYMAPEQATGRSDVDARADLYALAAVGFEALTTALPDVALEPSRLAIALRSRRPDLGRRVAEALVAPLAAARDRRPPTVDAWLDLLSQAERRSTLQPWTAVAALAAAGAVGWFALRGSHAPVSGEPVVAVLPFATTGTARGLDLDSVLPQALAWQLELLPDHRVLSAGFVRRELARRSGDETLSLDSSLALAATLGADLAVLGRGDATPEGLRLSIQVHDATRREPVASADTAGPADSLHALVSALVVKAFAERIARERSGWATPSLPRGLPAIAAYFQGDRDFRHGDYDRAVERFDRVIALDSAYAPAHYKRMLALVQLNPGETQIRSALRAAGAFRERLDPVSRQLLDAYETLVRRGDLELADRAMRDLVARYPGAVDAWFALGELQFHFAPLLGTPLSEAEAAFGQAAQLDPAFAAPVAHLITLAIARDDDDATRTHMRRYLQIDSTSVLAALVRAGDTLIFRPELGPRVIASFPNRPRAFLENLAFVASEFGRSPAERSVGQRAVDVLWNQAVGRDEKARAFRMRLAALLGSGRETSARAFLGDAGRAGVPRTELDRWLVLGGTTALPDLASDASVDVAARRLAVARDDSIVDQWLAARWFTGRDADLAADLTRHLRQYLHAEPDPLPMHQSLVDDLEARERLAAGDTAGALATWRRATQRFSIEQVPFALAASLWPLRLTRTRLAAASGRHREALDASESFVRIAGFVDQAAWPEVLHVRADAALALGDTALARNTYAQLVQLLVNADGAGVATRERAARELERLTSKPVPDR
ncbi:MAG: protein kinase [Gemmatimonadetes bacterium]|nr:protein kinase [Gemmatimonadota bacterium]